MARDEAFLDSSVGQAQRLQSQRTRSLRWLITLGAAAMLAVASVLVFLLALATNSQTRFEQYYERLLYLNVGVGAVFLTFILWAVWRLIS
jgi:hypothetical protein